MKKNAIILLFLLITAVFSLTGCGSKEETDKLSTYRTSMETFCENISYINDEINALDGTGESDVNDLLEHLDTLDDQFAQMADLEVPDEFAAVEDLADEASENMNMAVSYYHQAYEADVFNQNYADAAYEYYTRANVRLGYILQILHGEEVVGDNVKYVTDDEETEE